MEYIKLKEKEIKINIKNNANSKSVRMYVKDNILVITKPKNYSKNKVLSLLQEKEDEIYSNYIKAKKDISNYTNEKYILYRGEKLKLIIEYEKNILPRIKLSNKNVIIYLDYDLEEQQKLHYIKELVKLIYKKELEKIIIKKVDKYSKLMKVSYISVGIKYMTTRWGSCVKKTKHLNFSTKLAMFNDEIIDSVVVHELAHLIYADHSKNYWNIVYKYFPKYDECDKIIKQNKGYLEI